MVTEGSKEDVGGNGGGEGEKEKGWGDNGGGRISAEEMEITESGWSGKRGGGEESRLNVWYHCSVPLRA